MTAQPWMVRVSPRAAKAIGDLPPPAREMVRDVLDLAGRSPWGWPQWDPGDPEGEDIRAAAVGQLSVVYVVNRLSRHLAVLSISWLGEA
ncbi:MULTISPECIES: hypothetical protein [Streptomyces]|uniref:Type II toxin-antitoxin system RelE/ParE family toxin n=1 Tax=Streptomyces odorifer TaxID=53450 RepID=A0A7Y6F2D9_9ACTN|nr:hypothetical protein [Streptomyces odorifer]NUV30780.1 hypothetical protein [Streptomyces odorifer]NUV38093.1 hypothetical protein [Streptomyces sp. KAI-27]NUV45669.1 hypothetical protein [Streptomyces sp. CAI-78]